MFFDENTNLIDPYIIEFFFDSNESFVRLNLSRFSRGFYKVTFFVKEDTFPNMYNLSINASKTGGGVVRSFLVNVTHTVPSVEPSLTVLEKVKEGVSDFFSLEDDELNRNIFLFNAFLIVFLVICSTVGVSAYYVVKRRNEKILEKEKRRKEWKERMKKPL